MTNLSGAMGFFAAGTTNGMDAQGITDACRALVGASNVLTNDLDQDSLPDWWEIKYFGDLSAPGNQSNLDALNSGTDPNIVSFAFSFAGHRINAPQVTLQPEILSGIPSYYALLVNDTNYTTPVWTKLSGSVAFTLGATDGVYRVILGLKGRAPDSTITWLGTSVELDRVAPPVTITGPLDPDQSKSPIQLKGYAFEPLRTIVYSLSNGAGSMANLPGLLTGPGNFPTNDFQLLDLPLAPGSNFLSIAATDLAGNVTVTNLTYHLQLDTNSPVLQLYWPQNGSQVAASSVTVRGWLTDETASVTAQITHGGSVTYESPGLVDRNGKVWIEELPLGDGTNCLTLTATNAAGHSSSTNLFMVRSAVSIAIATVASEYLGQATVTLNGTITDDSYKIWANGVGAFPTNGAWTVAGVPVAGGPTAVFAVTAIPVSDNGGDGTPAPGGNSADPTALNPTSPQAVTAASVEDKEPQKIVANGDWHVHQEGEMPTDWWDNDWTWHWDSTNGGYAVVTFDSFDDGYWGIRYWVSTTGVERFEVWDTQTNNIVSTNWLYVGTYFWYGWRIDGPLADGKLIYPVFLPDFGYNIWTISAQRVKLLYSTGGKPAVARQNLFSFTGWATESLSPWNSRPIPYTEIEIPAIGRALGTDGLAYGALSDGIEPDITPILSYPYYSFDITPVKHKLQIKANATILLSDSFPAGTSFLVGEDMAFTYTWAENAPYSGPPPRPQTPTNKWTFDGTYVNAFTQNSASASVDPIKRDSYLTNSQTDAWWISGAPELPGALYRAVLDYGVTFSNGQHIVLSTTGVFPMLRPVPEFTSPVRDTVRVETNLVFDGKVEPNWRLQFGRNWGDTNIGIGFEYTNAPINPEDGRTFGHYFLVQVITNLTEQYNELIGTNCVGSELTASGLDGTVPYLQHYCDTNYGGWPDSPGGGLTSAKWLKISGGFKTHLMFRPGSPPEGLLGSIAVPLYEVDWKWYGIARTNGQRGWELVRGAPPLNPIPIETDVFPHWNSTAAENMITITNLPCFDEN
jgi:hypothetical protein